jgi:hypothetical protein
MKTPQFAAHFRRIPFAFLLFAGLAYADSFGAPGFDASNSLTFSDLEGFTLAPGSFLFSANTMYDFQGDYLLTLLSTTADPTQTNVLDPSQIQTQTFDLSSEKQSPIAPEPATGVLLAVLPAALLGRGLIRRRFRPNHPSSSRTNA